MGMLRRPGRTAFCAFAAMQADALPATIPRPFGLIMSATQRNPPAGSIIRRFAAQAFLAAAVFMPATGAAGQSLASRYDRLRQAEAPRDGQSDAGRAARVLAAYTRAFGDMGENYRTLDTPSLRILLSATIDAGRFSESATFPERAEACARELMARGQDIPIELRDIFGLLVKDRLFQRAAALRKDFPAAGLGPPPRLRAADIAPKRAVIDLDGAGAGLTGGIMHVPRDGILVVAQTQCHFTENAAREIAASPAYATLFRDHSAWLAPAEQTLDADALRRWDREYPAARLVVAARNSDFPEIRNWATPAFLFYRHGRLVAVSSGWRPGGGLADLAEGMRAIGIDPPPLPAHSPEAAATMPPEAISYDPNQFMIDRATAPVRSRADLTAYTQATPPGRSPFRYLAPEARRRFLAQLRFTPDGASRPDASPLHGLTVSQAYQILAVLGWQSMLASIPDLQTESAIDGRILRALGGKSRLPG